MIVDEVTKLRFKVKNHEKYIEFQKTYTDFITNNSLDEMYSDNFKFKH